MEENPKPRRRWFRFSLRTMLVLVTLVCMSVAGWKSTKNWVDARKERFAGEMFKHFGRPESWTIEFPAGTSEAYIRHYLKYQEDLHAYHEMLFLKYQYAVAHPWLPMEPDPPEPVKPFLGVEYTLGAQPE